MNNKFIVANFKSYKTQIEAEEWLNEIKNFQVPQGKEVIVCPPFTLLSFFKEFIGKNNLSIKLGSQDISPFQEGAYTGEVSGRQIKEFADYVLIGHSERRLNFNEKDEMLDKKVKEALKNNLVPIFLVQGQENIIPEGVKIIAYEPIFAIGSGTPDSPENADTVSGFFKEKNNLEVLYGGSVNSQNVNLFTSKNNISGVLVGGSSLDAREFIEIINHA